MRAIIATCVYSGGVCEKSPTVAGKQQYQASVALQHFPTVSSPVRWGSQPCSPLYRTTQDSQVLYFNLHTVTNNVTSVFTDSLNSRLYANLRNQFRYYYSTVILAKSQPVYLFKLFPVRYIPITCQPFADSTAASSFSSFDCPFFVVLFVNFQLFFGSCGRLCRQPISISEPLLRFFDWGRATRRRRGWGVGRGCPPPHRGWVWGLDPSS